MSELEQFTAERNEALASLDEARIRAFHRKWNDHEMPADPTVFWGAVHKTITGITTLPIELRRQAKRWLDERGYGSYDDGELS